MEGGVRYLVDYPYTCAEQRASAALALMLAAELGEAFHLAEENPDELRKRARDFLKSLSLLPVSSAFTANFCASLTVIFCVF